ncbi:MAG: hypothetical protein AAF740_07615 [Bacteroidota bacterium]
MKCYFLLLTFLLFGTEAYTQQAKKNRNTLTIAIDGKDSVTVNGISHPVENIEPLVRAHLTNEGKNPNLAESSELAVIELETDTITSYKKYLKVTNGIDSAYLTVRAEFLNLGIIEYLEVTRSETQEHKELYKKVTSKFPYNVNERWNRPLWGLPRDQDTGQPIPIKEKNVLKLKINHKDSIFIKGVPRKLEEVAGIVRAHLTNEGKDPNLAESSQEAIVSVRTSRGTSYDTYIHVMDEIKKTYHQVRADFLEISLNEYMEIAKKSTLDDKLIYDIAREKYPFHVSDAEPTRVGG